MPQVNGDNIYNCNGYRLPTEAEWEYAARAGTATATYAGNLSGTTGCVTLSGTGGFPSGTTLASIAWYDCNSASATKAVRGKSPNQWELYDMLGNVWEWTWDTYAVAAPSGTDPQTAVAGTKRVVRGGGWMPYAADVRAGERNSNAGAALRDWELGFRAARTIH
jgi:formylglycine-generating enzyme required for sulfatase activity